MATLKWFEGLTPVSSTGQAMSGGMADLCVKWAVAHNAAVVHL